jgi:hypothetical protein
MNDGGIGKRRIGRLLLATIAVMLFGLIAATVW